MLRIAIQSNGRLYHECLKLLEQVGVTLTIRENSSPVLIRSNNFPAEVLFIEKDRIPTFVMKGKVDLGIVSEYLAADNNVPESCIIRRLGFDRCSLSLAVPQGIKYKGLEWFIGKTIATPYPEATQNFFKSNNIRANAVLMRQQAASAPKVGLADAVCDRVDSGTTIRNHGMKVVATAMQSEACLMVAPNLSPQKQMILDEFLQRFEATQNAQNKFYAIMNVPNAKVDDVIAILPEKQQPSIIKTVGKQISAIHTIIDERRFWDIIDRLKQLGATDIVLTQVSKIVY